MFRGDVPYLNMCSSALNEARICGVMIMRLKCSETQYMHLFHRHSEREPDFPATEGNFLCPCVSFLSLKVILEASPSDIIEIRNTFILPNY